MVRERRDDVRAVPSAAAQNSGLPVEHDHAGRAARRSTSRQAPAVVSISSMAPPPTSLERQSRAVATAQRIGCIVGTQRRAEAEVAAADLDVEVAVEATGASAADSEVGVEAQPAGLAAAAAGTAAAAAAVARAAWAERVAALGVLALRAVEGVRAAQVKTVVAMVEDGDLVQGARKFRTGAFR
eukprot:scaffold25040_cov130-Isochrysis_galbana.AAC.4